MFCVFSSDVNQTSYRVLSPGFSEFQKSFFRLPGVTDVGTREVIFHAGRTKNILCYCIVDRDNPYRIHAQDVASENTQHYRGRIDKTNRTDQLPFSCTRPYHVTTVQ